MRHGAGFGLPNADRHNWSQYFKAGCALGSLLERSRRDQCGQAFLKQWWKCKLWEGLDGGRWLHSQKATKMNQENLWDGDSQTGEGRKPLQVNVLLSESEMAGRRYKAWKWSHSAELRQQGGWKKTLPSQQYVHFHQAKLKKMHWGGYYRPSNPEKTPAFTQQNPSQNLVGWEVGKGVE